MDETHKLSTNVQLQMGQSSTQSTYVKEDSDPIFQQEFVFLVYNPYVDNLDIKVIDTINGTIIGSTKIKTSDIMAEPNMEYSYQAFDLEGEIGGQPPVIKISANFRALQKSNKVLMCMRKVFHCYGKYYSRLRIMFQIQLK